MPIEDRAKFAVDLELSISCWHAGQGPLNAPVNVTGFGSGALCLAPPPFPGDIAVVFMCLNEDDGVDASLQVNYMCVTLYRFIYRPFLDKENIEWS